MREPANLSPRRLQPEGAAGRDPIVQLCSFLVGKEEYAVDIMRVEEILPPQRIIAVPHAPAFVEGMLHVRGALLPVVDLRQRLSLTAAPLSDRTRLLVCLLGKRRLALRVDRVTEVMRVRRSDIKPAPALLSPGRAPFVVGVCGPPERARLLLDIKALLRMEVERQVPRPGGAA
ncbi:chemotaxis protein CheW [Stigmatella sp. ncwal1]|uniref:Chemotaxis protein CheW n=1 Tax=Stigmatella ashevillensis TaxID=2995309 RepID=A0ABT5D9L5_9BACT|nr:chemotaxis protein CheW [Stigmatella ashevillena]MDC0708977.1 chemotaxis protein CheW [Stigmatella ashevillena]